MTEQEAQALVARLTRIWILVGVHSLGLMTRTGGWRFCCGGVVETNVYVSLEVDSDRGIEVAFAGSYGRLHWSQECAQIKWTRIHPLMSLLASPRPSVWGLLTGALSPGNWPGSWEPKAQDFYDQWLPLFRRNCWLCGCDIEATMHEKMEWMQGFSREEMDAWNLKF